MSIKERVKTYNFWVSITSAVILILKILGSKLGFTIDETLASDLITSVCSIFVLLGIIVPPTNKSNTLEICEPQNKISEDNITVQETDLKTFEETKETTQTDKHENTKNKNETANQIDNNNNVISILNSEDANNEPDFENLKSMLEYQKTLYLGNIDKYIETLQDQIDQIRKI